MPFAGEFIFRVRSWRRIVRFAGFATAALLSPSTYQQATRELAVRQIYYTACQVLFGYLLFTGLLSLVVIEIVFTNAGKYGLAQYSLELMLRVLVLEVLPLLTALFVALRSGAAIGAEIALMTVKGEIQDSEEAGRSPLHGELVPRIAGAALSVLSLTTLSCALATGLAYVSLYGFSAVGEDEFSLVVANVFGPQILMGLILKCLLFGLVVALIPVATGLEAERDDLSSAPNAVLGGLVKLFFVIGVIQILSLVAKYI
jgi:phospholipid/cholesterol/gamma-HCH transport system permease protein